MKSVINLSAAIKATLSVGLLNRLFYFTLVPVFAIFLNMTLAEPQNGSESWGILLRAALVSVLIIIYQLQIWNATYEYAKQISKLGKDEYSLGFAGFFTNWKQKFHLLMIRAIWIILLVVLVISIQYWSKLNETSFLAMVFITAVFYSVLIEPLIINTSQAIYAQTSNFWQVFTPTIHIKALRKHWVDFTILLGLYLIPNLIGAAAVAALESSGVRIQLQALLANPLTALGYWIFVVMLIGANALYYYQFLPHLYGQLWAHIYKLV